jgi:hypothetical protein
MNTKFSFNKIKGRLAETVVQELFLLNNYNVFNYGMERIMPGIMESFKNTKSPMAKSIRFMPDFVVQSRLTGDLCYLEVKFRANGKFSMEELDKDYPYGNAWFVIVTPGKIQAIHINMLIKKKVISPTTNYNLKGIKAFHLDEKLVDEFEEYSATLFKGF